jgi:four helix bundle protein
VSSNSRETGHCIRYGYPSCVRAMHTPTIQRFEDLETWKESRALVASVCRLSRQPTIRADYGLIDQLRRATVSIMSNIAEGFDRVHLQEKLQFYNIAKGSAGEVRSLLYVVEDVFPEHSAEASQLRLGSNHIAGKLTGLIRSTEARKKAPLNRILSFFL